MVVCEVRPDKDNPDRTRITIGGNRICYPGDVGTNTASLELFKLLLNSVLSCKGMCFSSIDLKNLYLNTPMPDPEYVRIKIKDIPVQVRTAMVGSTSKFAKVVMVCSWLASLPMISSDPTLLLKVTMRWNPPLASGATNSVPSDSASLLMTLE